MGWFSFGKKDDPRAQATKIIKQKAEALVTLIKNAPDKGVNPQLSASSRKEMEGLLEDINNAAYGLHLSRSAKVQLDMLNTSVKSDLNLHGLRTAVSNAAAGLSRNLK